MPNARHRYFVTATLRTLPCTKAQVQEIAEDFAKFGMIGAPWRKRIDYRATRVREVENNLRTSKITLASKTE